MSRVTPFQINVSEQIDTKKVNTKVFKTINRDWTAFVRERI